MNSFGNFFGHTVANRRLGFTLVEVVTLAALFCFLGMLFIPVLANTKPGSQDARCLNNLRQLGNAWRMYADDSDGGLVYNGESRAPNRIWVGGWLDYSTSPDNTNTALLVDHAQYTNYAYLGPYVKSAAVFKCPADRSTVTVGGEKLARVRSVSMNWWVGAGTRTYLWGTRSSFQFYRSFDAIASPTPANLWIILDEREESIGGGSMLTNPDTPWQLVDYPAAYHNRAAGLVYADGRSEIHRWSDPRTTVVLEPGQSLPSNSNQPGNVDITWLNEHATSRP